MGFDVFFAVVSVFHGGENGAEENPLSIYTFYIHFFFEMSVSVFVLRHRYVNHLTTAGSLGGQLR